MKTCPKGHPKTRWRTASRRNTGWWECHECRSLNRKPRPRGEQSHRAKVSDATVERMIWSRAHGVTSRELARIYGLHEDTVGRLTRRVGRVDQREGAA